MYKVLYRVVGTSSDSEAVCFSKSPKKAWSSAEDSAEENFEPNYSLTGVPNHFLGVDCSIWKDSKLIHSSEWSD